MAKSRKPQTIIPPSVRYQALRSMIAGGKSQHEIIRELGISRRTYWNDRKALGLTTNSNAALSQAG